MDLWCSQKKSTILNIESNHSFQCHCSKLHYLLNHLVFEFVTSLFSQTRQFNWRQHGCCINSIQFLGSFHTCWVKSFSKFLITWILAFYFSQKFQRKYSMATSLNFIVIEIKNLEPRSGLLGLNHVVFQENIYSDYQYVTVRSWKIFLNQIWITYFHLVVFIIFVIYLILTPCFLFKLATWLLRTLLFKKIEK